MTQQIVTVTCIRCGHRWDVDVAKLGRPNSTLYKGENKRLRVETYRVTCPNSGTINMVDVTFEERPHA